LSSKSLSILANEENLTPEKLKNFIDNWANTPITGIIQSDNRGKIISAFSNTESLLPGGDISDRDYFQTAKNSPTQKMIVGKPVISRATGTDQSYKIPLATPIYKNGQFRGVISLSVSASSLTQNYLESLKISDQSDIILIDQDGYFLSSVHSEIIGQNIFDYFKEHPFLGDKIVMPIIREKIKIDNEQKLDVAIPNLFTGKLTRTLMVSSPIKLDHNQWILVITTPVSDALIFISPFILRNLLGIIVSFFISIGITLFLFNRYIKN
ncbi:MAG: cache domain-containing protein, partial [Candidatus Shapirobacteria bacterium]